MIPFDLNAKPELTPDQIFHNMKADLEISECNRFNKMIEDHNNLMIANHKKLREENPNDPRAKWLSAPGLRFERKTVIVMKYVL